MVNFHVLELNGEIDIAQRQRLARELDVIEEFEPESVVILDLTGVNYVDTTLLNALIRIRNHFHGARSDGSIRLVAHPNNNIRKLLAVTNFDRIFPAFDDLAAARGGVGFTDVRALLTANREGP
jgi:anti-anti-sigma factor